MGFVNIGPLELLLIGIIALLVLGPARLPEAARSVGRGVREMKDALSGIGEDEDEDLREPELDDVDEDDEEPEEDEPAPPRQSRPALDS